MARKQCAKCPWKTSTDPNDIPSGYCETKHRNLQETIAVEADMMSALVDNELRMMACHEFATGKEVPCVGWLANQLGPGNNVVLRMACRSGQIDADFELVGEQHEVFSDTLPR